MRHCRVVLFTVLAATIAACGAAPSAQRTATPAVSLAPAEAPTAVPATAPVPTAAPPSPTPTPNPPPKRPTGMRYEIGILTLCGDKSDPEFTCDEIVAEERVTWRKPRAKGLVVRVFGVTECLASDSSGAFVDGGWCLRQSWVNDVYGVMVGGGPSVEHTAVPPGLLVPLAKGRAPKGKVVVSLGDNYLAVVPDPDDPDQEGALYAIVAAVYDTDGQRSPFAVVYSAHYCEVIEALNCPAAVDTQVRYYSVR